MAVAVVFGTRPEMIKLAPLISLLRDRVTVIHTGQHYDDSMSASLLQQLNLGEPHHHLRVGGLTRGAQIGEATTAIEQVLLDGRPACLVVQGDTNAGLAGALAANAADVPLVHLEAGLRSFDRSMPEEHNRVLIDALSDLCLAPHQRNADQLRREGVAADRIRVTGSTLYDAVTAMLPTHAERDEILQRHGLTANSYVLATIHRAENADDEHNLSTILEQLASLPAAVLLTLHPRTRARIAAFGLGHLLDRLRVAEPLGYRDFLSLAAECAVLVSDSGGVQEEAAIVKRPVVVVRRSTERPELLGTFAHLAAVGPEIGAVARSLLSDVSASHAALAGLPYPYGESSGSRCVDAISELLASS